MKLVGYARVSTVGQAKDGLGIPTQERLLRQWAKSNGHRLVRVVSENGKSGTLPVAERPVLLETLAAVKRGDVDGLVVTSLDRLARALDVQEAILAQVWSAGARVFTVDAGEVPADDPDDPMRTALRKIVGVIAELDRAMITKRLRNGRATKAARGGYAGGGPPFGWRAEDGELVEDEREQLVLARARELWEELGQLAPVARHLNDEGLMPRRGRWHPTTVKRALERPAR